MCGRYVEVSSPELLAERFHLDEVAVAERPGPDYNVAPRKQVLTVVQRAPESGSVRALEQMRWGLVPSWAENPRIGDRLVNARAESISGKPAFQRAFRRRRCILPADGFYEWKVLPGRRQKQPMFFRRHDGEPIAFAGLWEVWRPRDDPDAPWLRSCVIITTRANTLMEPVHDRMPVILPERAWDAWLEAGNEDLAALEGLLVPADDDVLEMWPVGTMVNDVRNNGPELVDPAPPETLFP